MIEMADLGLRMLEAGPTKAEELAESLPYGVVSYAYYLRYVLFPLIKPAPK